MKKTKTTKIACPIMQANKKLAKLKASTAKATIQTVAEHTQKIELAYRTLANDILLDTNTAKNAVIDTSTVSQNTLDTKSIIEYAKNNLLVYIMQNGTPKQEYITSENIHILAQKIAIQALKTHLQKSGQKFAIRLYNNAIIDINNQKNIDYVFTDSMDIIQLTIQYLMQYVDIKHSLNDYSNDINAKTGEHKSIKNACYSVINKYIYGQKKQLTKSVWIDLLDNTEYRVPKHYDIANAKTLTLFNSFCKKINLTDRQKQILKYRYFLGLSHRQIAKKLGVYYNAINKTVAQIRTKTLELLSTKKDSVYIRQLILRIQKQDKKAQKE